MGTGALIGCKDTATPCCLSQGHPQHVPAGAACAQAAETPLPAPRPRQEAQIFADWEISAISSALCFTARVIAC